MNALKLHSKIPPIKDVVRYPRVLLFEMIKYELNSSDKLFNYIKSNPPKKLIYFISLNEVNRIELSEMELFQFIVMLVKWEELFKLPWNDNDPEIKYLRDLRTVLINLIDAEFSQSTENKWLNTEG